MRPPDLRQGPGFRAQATIPLVPEALPTLEALSPCRWAGMGVRGHPLGDLIEAEACLPPF